MLPSVSPLKASPMLRIMSRRALHRPVASRMSMIARHVTSAADGSAEQPLVLFESHLATRTYVLNRPSKKNALTAEMIRLLRSKIQEWDSSMLCVVVLGTGKRSAFCSGGDILSVMQASEKERTRPFAISFFKDEFELNHQLGNLVKPYVAIMDGITMGGGAGLSLHAPFRVATENTVFAMPETKIGYIPDVGSNHFLSQLDGELGTYLSLTAAELRGRAVFEHGIATHFIPSSRIPDLKARLSSLENPSPDLIDAAIEELYFERGADEAPPKLIGNSRIALDAAFSGKTAEDIVATLTTMAQEKDDTGKWAAATLDDIHMRSPTSVKVALEAIRRAKNMTLGEVLQMEMNLATAFINGASQDFFTGVRALFIDKLKGQRPNWNPSTLAEVSDDKISKDYFDADSSLTAKSPQLSLKPETGPARRDYALPSEDEIEALVLGSHATSSGTAQTLDTLLAHLRQLRGDKHGLREKVTEVVSRRCKVSQDSDSQGYLQWKH